MFIAKKNLLPLCIVFLFVVPRHGGSTACADYRMYRIKKMLRRNIGCSYIFLLFIVVLLAAPCASEVLADNAALKSLVSLRDEEHQQIVLLFDHLPSYVLSSTDRRVELKMACSRLAEPFTSLPADSRAMRARIRQEGQDLLLTLFFRYPPQHVEVRKVAASNMLIMDILPGNQLTALYPGMMGRMHELQVKPGKVPKAANPLSISRYARDWASFFVQHEAPISVHVAPGLLLPPFPLLALAFPEDADSDGLPWLPEQAREAAAAQDWARVRQILVPAFDQVIDQALQQNGKNFCADPLPFTFAEAMARDGQSPQMPKQAQWLLQRLSLHCPDTLHAPFAQLLLLHLMAREGDPHAAALALPSLIGHLPHTSLAPYLRIMQAELDLLAGNIDQAANLLTDDFVVTDPALHRILLLRRADLAHTQQKNALALRLYQDLWQQDSQAFDHDAAALERFARLLYEEGRYQVASAAYARLSERLPCGEQRNLAIFRRIIADLKAGDQVEQAMVALTELSGSAPDGTLDQGMAQAWLRLTDLRYSRALVSANEAEQIYGDIAARVVLASTREEAGFRQALVNALAGQHEKSVAQCMDLLRGFQSGKLREETLALLVSQLGVLLEHMVDEQRYAEALVLAAQNRYIFSHDWPGHAPYYALAKAYQALGLHRKSAETYRYLYDISVEAERLALYPLLVRALLASGERARAELFAELYLSIHAEHGQAAERTIMLELKAEILFAEGRYQEVLAMQKAPRSPRLNFLRGQAFYALKQWKEALALFNAEELRDFIAQHPRLLAETAFHERDHAQAGLLFQQLRQEEQDQDLALFRLAQIAAMKNRRQEAIQMFDELGKNGKDPLWRRTAREEAALLRLQEHEETALLRRRERN